MLTSKRHLYIGTSESGAREVSLIQSSTFTHLIQLKLDLTVT